MGGHLHTAQAKMQSRVDGHTMRFTVSQTPLSSNALYLLFICFTPLSTLTAYSVAPPLPILPLPSASQLRWQLSEIAFFFHFGINTFTDSEWGSGLDSPVLFFPARFDAAQWIEVAVAAGFWRVILTVKHHDGFCLWQTQYTNYSVSASPWKEGKGDVLSELSTAAKEAGIGLGIYLSPWDRHEVSYGDTIKYNEFYMGQMTELLTRYGEIEEVWVDGAKGEGSKDMYYYFDLWFATIHQLQPNAVIFSDAGPDTRWVGNEEGSAGSSCWSPFNRSSVTIGGDNDSQYCKEGDPHGMDWVPPECDVSIRPGWFWHTAEHPKSALALLDIYYKSVGRNCLLLLNVPPNSSGLISEEDIQVLLEFTELRKAIFLTNLAENSTVTASSIRGNNIHFSPSNVLQEGIYTYWAPEEGHSLWVLYFDMQKFVKFNVLQLHEPIQLGQRVYHFHFDILKSGKWQTVLRARTVGYKKVLLFAIVESRWMRLVIDKSRSDPLISYVGIHLDPFSDAGKFTNGGLHNENHTIKNKVNNSYGTMTKNQL